MTDGAVRDALRVAARPTDADVLLVEDDDGDALLVEALIEDSGEPLSLARATTVREALAIVGRARCALVDLGLPDAAGLEAVARLRAGAPDLAVVVLTGLAERERGIAALAAGAQDYLVKGEVDGPGLARAVRYAVERRAAEVASRRLLLAEQRQAENDRLARGLLPTLRLGANRVDVATRYRPGGRDALVGGDFFDALDCGDGSVRAIIGDVCGHGPDEAATGVALRIAWRALTLAEADPSRVLAGVDEILRQERGDDTTFATVCDITIHPDEGRMSVRLHGHPPPLLLGDGARWADGVAPAMPLGVFDHQEATSSDVALPEDWGVLLVTDNVYEARVRGEDRLGMEPLAAIAARVAASAATPHDLLDGILQQVVTVNGGPLDDDAALLWFGPRR